MRRGGRISTMEPELLYLLGICFLSTITAQPFDGGAVGSCEVPQVRGQCYGTVNYPVPSSIARSAIVAIKEQRVQDLYRHQQTILVTFNAQGQTPQLEVCLDTYKAILCRIEFPRCQQDNTGAMQVVLNQQDCSELYRVCPRLFNGNIVVENLGRQLANPHCFNYPNATLPAGGCRPISELIGSYVPRGCFSDRSMMVTPWMFEIMKYEDSISISNQCDPHLVEFQCNALGRCTEDGQRIELVNTEEQCYSIVDW